MNKIIHGTALAVLAVSLLTLTPTQQALANHHEGEANLAQALASENRASEDRDRDQGRKPVEVLAFLGVKPGMTVVDLLASGGWYTEVLSLAVGHDGKVYAQNSPAMLKFRDGANDKAMAARLAGNRLPNVSRLDADVPDMNLAPGSVDFVITALNFHDIYNGRGEDAAIGTATLVFAMLKPGGVFGVIDHVGIAGADNAKLHRIDPALVTQALGEAGFIIDATSSVLANPADDHTLSVFDPSIRGNTDRFVIRASKPAN